MLLFVLCGLAVAGGLVALVAGLVGTREEKPEARPGSGRLHTFWYGAPGTASPGRARTRQVQAVLATAGGAGAWLFTGIPLTVLLLPLAVFGLPWLYDATRSDTRRIERLEALAEWTQRLADVLLLGVGLNQAIVTSRRTAPPALETQIGDLAARLQSRWRPEDALRAFGDELADATADKVLAALLLRAGDSGPGLARALADIAESVREEVRQRRAIEADRAKHRTTVRWLVGIILVVIAAGALNPRYTAPYASVTGQVVLAVVAAAFVGVIAWMRSLAAHSPLPRLIEPDRRSKAGRMPGDRVEAEPAPEAAAAAKEVR
ncbi:type II secretion system F family protein [Kitasatospora sp. DSM 101779]|uniref:type II secretion system F family protein n=1 Tax=Kitasatospora sp. DSM 101779 TaxID=2853165 RepID=UPI0021DA948B|nr:type II secretion system F family protein [Kitasatospora sp. DSM 101779]MCU7821755.1 type II secretion system F family protein [Kitasatospora sp. DSM 101779]